MIKEETGLIVDDSFVDNMGSVSESLNDTRDKDFNEGVRVQTISNFDFDYKITKNNTS